MSQVSKDFVTVTSLNIDDKTNSLLKLSGHYFDVDRSYLFLFTEDNKIMRYTHEWCNNGIDPGIDIVGEMPVSTFPWWMKQILNGYEVHIPDVNNLSSDEASLEKEILLKQGIQSLIAVPVKNEGKIFGFVGFDAVNTVRHWTEEHRNALWVLANTLSDAMLKVEAEKEIHRLAF